jgi:drug/metabolite transporter (DMT)-like permease
MDRGRAIGIALVIVSACAFGSGALFGKPVYETGVGWLTLLAWRFLLGAALSWLLLVSSAGHRAGLRSMGRRATIVALGLGVLYVGNSSTYFAGLETVPASLAGLIVYIYPALVAVLSIRYGRPLEGRRAWAALGLALVGVVLALGGIPDTEMPPLSALLQILASPVIYAVWIVLAARLSGERGPGAGRARDPAADRERDPAPDERDGAETTAASAVMMTATATTFWLMALATSTPVAPATIPTAAWGGLIGVGVVSTFVAIQTFYAGTKRVGAAQASLISTIEPVWTIVLAAFLLGERLTLVQLAGGGLILVAVVLAQTSPGGAVRALRMRLRIADE